MADDIDDLLSEVESKFCSKDNRQTHSTGHSTGPKHTSKSKSYQNEDLDDLINEIFDDEGDKGKFSSKKQMSNQSRQSSFKDSVSDGKGSSTSLSQKNKCFAIYLGGSSCEHGLSTTVNSRCCDKLRCTDCDFQVAAFDNYQWHSSVDYLFLRNNMPDFPKLKLKLVVKKGSRAYSCQCKWKSAKGEKLINLQSEPDLKWVCGKH